MVSTPIALTPEEERLRTEVRALPRRELPPGVGEGRRRRPRPGVLPRAEPDLAARSPTGDAALWASPAAGPPPAAAHT